MAPVALTRQATTEKADDMETKSINWAHHRNGVAGWPFKCHLHGWSLQVQFSSLNDEDEGEGVPAAELGVNVDWVRRVADASSPGGWETCESRGGEVMRRVVVALPGDSLVVFDELTEDGAQRMAALSTGDPDDYMTAVFNLGMLVEGNVTFGENSWRGDSYHGWVLRQLS